ncbi:uncharacterized protein LOC124820299 [Vigna umbellata]|uniref:uncharacterized protein LOC124820299 n=1 Tax=Vigna umbellata TaxID=87088 RepID=UPI001F5F7C33|nr:uncharacterized protein LOC124820299 [Vigna umbellata]
MCRAFSLSLKEETLEWYNTLPPNTVDCFATVENLFRRQYASNRKQEVTPADLVNTKQEKGETLKAFMKRKRQQEANVGGSRKDGKRPFDNNDKNREFPRPFKFHHYTTLNAPRAEVLEEALSAELLTPRRKPSPRNADERKSCRYHQNHGHTTEDCITLKNEIENLIRAGHLRRFIKEARYSLPKEGYSRRSPERANRKDERGRGYSRSPSRHRERSVRGFIN